MPITISYDLSNATNNQRTYIRSMFERFHWQHLGGSVFRYSGVDMLNGPYEDWLNHVTPSLMFFRSYLAVKGILLTSFTLDASSITLVRLTADDGQYGVAPLLPEQIAEQFAVPTNEQSSRQRIENFIRAGESSLIDDADVVALMDNGPAHGN